VCVCTLIYSTVLKYFYYSNVLYYCYNYCAKYSVLLLAVFVNVLMCIIFKLNCVLGMYEY
jgi:hypothetical protein